MLVSLRSELGVGPVSTPELPRSIPTSVPAQLTATLSPVGLDSFAIDADRGGQFETTMLIAGHQFPAMVDTGATLVSLSYDTAASLGIHPSTADFKYVVQTANGTARAAATVLRSVRVGNVEARDVQALISAPGALTTHNLLGMSFLRKLSGFEFQSGRLLLKQ